MPKIKIYTVFKGTDREFTGNMKEISENFNVNYSNLIGRIKSNYSLEEAINFYDSRVKIYTVFKNSNREFTGNLTDIANHFNIKYGNLRYRLMKNLTLEEAIDYKQNMKNKNYIGETKLMNCGMECTIIDYIKYNNIIVQFEDGSIIKNKRYYDFKKGQIKNPNLIKHIGETRLMKCGAKCTIIKYTNAKNITVLFEDGTVVKNKGYQNFKEGRINNPNFKKHVGETKMMNCGMKCTIIEYFGANNITIQFEDGTVIENRTYQNFKRNEILNPNFKFFTVFKCTDTEFTGNMKEISNHFGINYENLRYRVNNNMTIEEAINLPQKRVKQNDLIYKNQNGTMKELCKLFNKNYIEVYNKVKFNHTFEWAMDSTIEPYIEE